MDSIVIPMTIIWTIAFMALIYMAILLGDKNE
jgi:hypothetical protein